MTDEEKEKTEPEAIPGASIDVAPDDSAESDVVEFVFNDDGEEDIKATLKKLRKDLKEAKAKEAEYLAALQRERADFINYKKDESSRSSRVKEIATEQFVEELLPVLDAYDLAFANKEAWEKVEKNWRMGVEYIHQQLLKVLAENGVVPITVNVGDMFDSNFHEPIETVTTDELSQDHTIAGIIQQGYKINDRVLRPARVRVYGMKH